MYILYRNCWIVASLGANGRLLQIRIPRRKRAFDKGTEVPAGVGRGEIRVNMPSKTSTVDLAMKENIKHATLMRKKNEKAVYVNEKYV